MLESSQFWQKSYTVKTDCFSRTKIFSFTPVVAFLLSEKDDDYAEQEEEEEDDDYPEDGEETLIDARDEDEQDEELYDEEYDYANPNPVFRDGDFDPALANADANANNASRPEPLRFQAAEQGQRAVEDGYDDANGAYYADNGADADEYAEEHDTHVNGRMLRSEPVAPSDQDVNRVKHATRFHTPLKLQNSHINAQDAQRRLRTPVANSHQRSRHKSNKILFQNHVPNVVVDNSIARDSVIQTGRQQASDQDFRAPAHVSREGRAGSRAARPPLPAAAAAVPEAPATQIQTPRQPRRLGPVVYSNAGFPIVEDSVFWSQRVESFVPPGEMNLTATRENFPTGIDVQGLDSHRIHPTIKCVHTCVKRECLEVIKGLRATASRSEI